MVSPDPAHSRLPTRFSTWAPFPIAILMAVAATMGIANPAIYARETASWAAQGKGQDWINLVVCAPALLAAGGLDLSLLLPAMIVVGVSLLRRRASGIMLASILLTFAVMMAIAIGGMVAMMWSRGLALDPTPAIAMAVIAAWCLGVLIALLRHVRR